MSYLCVEASSLQSSLAQLSVPLDRVRAARQSLSFTWCSMLAAVSLLVLLQLAAAGVRRCVASSARLRRWLEAPPTAAAEAQSPSSGVSTDLSAVDRDAVPASATAPDRRSVDDERRGNRHQHRPASSRHSALQSPPQTRLSPPCASYSNRQHRSGFTTATRVADPVALRMPTGTSSYEFPINVERVYYTDGIVESNV